MQNQTPTPLKVFNEIVQKIELSFLRFSFKLTFLTIKLKLERYLQSILIFDAKKVDYIIIFNSFSSSKVQITRKKVSLMNEKISEFIFL